MAAPSTASPQLLPIPLGGPLTSREEAILAEFTARIPAHPDEAAICAEWMEERQTTLGDAVLLYAGNQQAITISCPAKRLDGTLYLYHDVITVREAEPWTLGLPKLALAAWLRLTEP